MLAHVRVCAEAVVLRLDRHRQAPDLLHSAAGTVQPPGSLLSERSRDTHLPGCTMTSSPGGQEAGGQESCAEAHRAEQLVLALHFPSPLIPARAGTSSPEGPSFPPGTQQVLCKG